MKPIPQRPPDAGPRDEALEEQVRRQMDLYFYSHGSHSYSERSTQEIWDNGGEPSCVTPILLRRYVSNGHDI